jgi:hypothetical protein
MTRFQSKLKVRQYFAWISIHAGTQVGKRLVFMSRLNMSVQVVVLILAIQLVNITANAQLYYSPTFFKVLSAALSRL